MNSASKHKRPSSSTASPAARNSSRCNIISQNKDHLCYLFSLGIESRRPVVANGARCIVVFIVVSPEIREIIVDNGRVLQDKRVIKSIS